MFKFIKSIKRFLNNRKIRKNSANYIKYLKSKGIKIGEDCYIFEPHDAQIDITRPELLEIGDHVFLHKGIRILTHDWGGWCYVFSNQQFIPSHGKIKIGSNVWFGENVCVCKGVTIGDNCIIGIGSVVTKSIPSNSVAVGVPARVVCTYEEYFEKRKKQFINEAVEYANAILDRGREPQIEDFYDDYPAFVDGHNYMEYDYPYKRVFKNNGDFEIWKRTYKAPFDGFDQFMKYVKEQRK